MSSSGLIEAALEPLGDDADEDETFLYLADQEGNDQAVELVHELLWEECINDTQKDSTYGVVDEDDDQNSACLLGELYCKQEDNKYIFEDVFETLVNHDLDNYIRSGNGANYRGGLDLASSDYDDLDVVCGDVICHASHSRRIAAANACD